MGKSIHRLLTATVSWQAPMMRMAVTKPGTQLAPLVPPSCDACSKSTRLVGLEPVPTGGDADLCTYECGACGNVQTRVFLRPKRSRK